MEKDGQKLLTRDEFRSKTFERDGHACGIKNVNRRNDNEKTSQLF